MTTTEAHTGAAGGSAQPSLVDALLSEYDPSLDEIANCVFHDDGAEVRVSAVDQLLLAFTTRLLTDQLLGHVGIVQLPRYKNRNALLLAICSQLLCRRPPARLQGPVVFVGFDVAVADQLRTLAVRNFRRMGLGEGNPLSMHRITRSGSLEPVIGNVRGNTNSALIYFNTRIGDPPLSSAAPLVIVDGTAVVKRAARERVLNWATEHQAAAVVVLSDIGDDDAIRTCENVGMVPTVLAVTQPELDQLAYDLGRQATSNSPLSSMGLLWAQPTTVEVVPVAGAVINDAIARAYGTLGAKPEGPVPPELEMPLKLLRNGTRLAARVRDYRTACTHNTRPGELPLLHRLERMTFIGPPGWRSWGSTRFGTLKVAVKNIWDALEEENPKLLSLWGLLDRIDHGDGGGRILIRCHTPAAAEATRTSLCSGDRTDQQLQLWDWISERVTFATFKERYPAGHFKAQILTGAPPPWLLSPLFGVEAEQTYVLAYDAEESLLRGQLQRNVEHLDAWRAAAARTLAAAPPRPLDSPVAAARSTAPESVAAALHVPELSLADVLERAAQGVDARDIEVVPGTQAFSVGQKDCIPIVLDDGRTWWCIDDGHGTTPVLTITAGGHGTRPVSQLRAGDTIVVPAGEGTESVHARLVAASRSNDDVRALDLILGQFRAAARAVRGNGTRREAVERVRRAGAQAAGELHNWEQGTTIAPREPGDVAAVFEAAGRPCPDLGLIYAVAGKLRSLNIILGRFVAAMAVGRGADAVGKLRELVGTTADEILDEFVVVTVREVKTKRSVSGAVAGKLR
jgi:hypothetical protein